MACLENCFKVDKTTYITAAPVIKSLGLEVTEKTKTFLEVSGGQNNSPELFQAQYDNFFLGFLREISPCKETCSFCFKLDELSMGGLRTGKTFHFAVDNKTYNTLWFSHPVVKSAVSLKEKFIFIFQNVPFQIKNKEIHLNLELVQAHDTFILVKHFMEAAISPSLNHPYKPLAQAAAIESRKLRTVYAVVCKMIKNPTVTTRGTGHAMLALVDPSCYSSQIKLQEFIAQVFVSSLKVFPKILVGDVVKLNQVMTEKRLRTNGVEFRVTRDEELIVFPNDWNGPLCPAERFTVTEVDIDVVNKLKLWFKEVNAITTVPLRTKTVPVQQQTVAAIIPDNLSRDSPLNVDKDLNLQTNVDPVDKSSQISPGDCVTDTIMREIPSCAFSNNWQDSPNECLAEIGSVCLQVQSPTFSQIVTSSQKDAVAHSRLVTPETFMSSLSSTYGEESVIHLSLSQTNLEDLFLKSIANVPRDDEDPNRFQIAAQIKDILPSDATTNAPVISLDRLLVAFCYQCKKSLNYEKFNGSKSTPVFRHTYKYDKINNEQEIERITFNYLCSEENHDRNMIELAKNDNVDMSRYEDDDSVFLDNSFVFVCPYCKRDGLPDSICRLEPTFLFQLHLTGLDDGSCLHVNAFGIHAEYFLGTKANHVLRSSEVWKRAEKRLAKLSGCHTPLILSLRKNPNLPSDIHLENTCIVYDSYQILPF